MADEVVWESGETVGIRHKLLLVASFLMLFAYSAPDLWATLSNGYELTSAVLLLSLGVIGALCAAYVFAPEQMARWFARHTALDLTRTRHVLALALLFFIFFYVFGLLFCVNTAFMFESIYLKGVEPGGAYSTDALALVSSMTSNLFFMLVLTIAYVKLAKGGSLRETLAALKFKKNKLGKALLFGALAMVMFFAINLILGLIMYNLGVEAPVNEGVEQIGAVLTIPLAIFLAAGAAFSEEFLFRGLIQQRIGIVGASVLFGMAHFSYLNALQVIFPIIMGLILGWILVKTDNLVAPIAAHFLYDLFAFALAMSAF